MPEWRVATTSGILGNLLSNIISYSTTLFPFALIPVFVPAWVFSLSSSKLLHYWKWQWIFINNYNLKSSNLAGLITVIDATSPATTNQTVKVCSFPSGYTWNNSTLIAAIKQGDSYKYQNSNINTYLKIDGVYMYTADTNNLNCPCRVCLIKNNHLIP